MISHYNCACLSLASGEGHVQGSLQPTTCLDPVTSNKVFLQLLPLLEMLDENTLEVISKILKPTSINLTGINMTEKIFEVIRSFNLT
ncbi:hypothetical protein L3Y34_019521 [Caenorhabditis briggsae]|uniref:Uncharacterized protein n=1 Tax=Caenorhabditis briggsae TaxID=6238 RepID=A0AAE9DQ47_CAEBR|nr:hypothetical protein L3Y34_019521 [Caenorhabditis briggsae]